MEIDHAAVIGFDQCVGNAQQEACQHDKMDVVLLLEHGDKLRLCQLDTVGDQCRHMVRGNTLEHRGIGPVADHQDGLYGGMIRKVADQILAVGAVSRHKYGYPNLHRLPPIHRRQIQT